MYLELGMEQLSDEKLVPLFYIYLHLLCKWRVPISVNRSIIITVTPFLFALLITINLALNSTNPRLQHISLF